MDDEYSIPHSRLTTVSRASFYMLFCGFPEYRASTGSRFAVLLKRTLMLTTTLLEVPPVLAQLLADIYSAIDLDDFMEPSI